MELYKRCIELEGKNKLKALNNIGSLYLKNNKPKSEVKKFEIQLDRDFQKSLPVTLNGKVNYYVEAFRNFGHSAANLDPLGIEIKEFHKDLIYAEKLISNENE